MHKRYAHSDVMEKVIDEKYEPELSELRSRRERLQDSPRGIGFQESFNTVIDEESRLTKLRADEYAANGVEPITYGAFNSLIGDALRGRPEHQFHLARREVLYVGSGVILATVSSIWSVWL